MKLHLIALVSLAPLLDPGYALPAAQDKEAPAAQGAPKPGPEHAMLQKLAGTWDAVVLTKDEKGAEQKSKGTMTTRKSSDFHTVDDFQGEFMGTKFVGHGINGYCTIKKQYYTFWTDSMVPSPAVLSGSYDQKKKELVLTGEAPGMSGKIEKCRTVTTYKDDDHYSWALYSPGPDGKESVHLQIEYSRRK